ncbi:MAG: MurR/RpiR family transcriptional regulator [Pseudomonadota bacterium]
MTVAQRIPEMIRVKLDSLGASERRVAHLLVEEPETYSGAGLATLAEKANVSQPTVIRFCRKLGFKGFSDFKVAFAQSLAIEPLASHQDIDPKDTSSDIIRKVSQSAIQAITGVRDATEPTEVARAAELIGSARRVEFLANGAAKSVAVEGHNKLYRLGVPCGVTSDAFTQTVLANILGPGDMLLAISFSGTAALQLNAVEAAQQSGATVIALTRPRSPLAKRADAVVGVTVLEDFETFTPLSSPLAFMVALDAVIVAAGSHRPEGTIEKHQRGKVALSLIKDVTS